MDNLEKMINEYCGSLEDRFDACKDKRVAELLKERICWEFQQEKTEKLKLSEIKNYLDELINNKFLNSQT